jgi:5-formyltetrahydrofolate cyclo-ligase
MSLTHRDRHPRQGRPSTYSEYVTAPGPIATAKRELRDRVRAVRARTDPTTRRSAADLLADNVTTLVADHETRHVAAYISLPDEPGTGPLVERLYASGVPVMLPVLLPDLDLDWAYHRPDRYRPGRFGLVEPSSPRLGVDALRDADLIVCPGVAGSPAGVRLGRGGGSYDRALARSRATSLRCLLLYDDEILADVPTDVHDQRVDVIVTPGRILWTSAGRL